MILFTIGSIALFGQYLEVTPLFGYTFGGKYHRDKKILDVKDDLL